MPTQPFDTFHLSYLITSLILSAVILVLAKLLLKKQRAKNIFLLVFGILPFAIHISLLWGEFFIYGRAIAYDNILFAIYPCNVVMFMVLYLGGSRRKNTYFFQGSACFAFYVGIVGNLAGLFYPTYYYDGLTFEAVKSLLSHSTLFICCWWLLLGGYFKIRLTNIIPYALGCVGGLIIGLLNFSIFKISGAPYLHIMYIGTPAIPNTPLTIWVIMPLSCLFVALIGYLGEFAYPKELRSYHKFRIFDQKNPDGSNIEENKV